MMSFTDINASLASIQRGITQIHVDVDNNFTYFWKQWPLILFPFVSSAFQPQGNVGQHYKRHPNDPEKDISYYCELLKINVIIFGDHLVVIVVMDSYLLKKSR